MHPTQAQEREQQLLLVEASENDTCQSIAKRCKMDEKGKVIVDHPTYQDYVDVIVIVCVSLFLNHSLLALTRLTGSAMGLTRC